MQRSCGSPGNRCDLCCRLLPMRADAFKQKEFAETIQAMVDHGMAMPTAFEMVKEFDKPAGERCQFQRHGKGCTVYEKRPFGCRFWQCQWLQNGTGDLPRPDRLHLVIDVIPDFVESIDNVDGSKTSIPVVQVWIDPKHPHAHRDPAFRAWLAERAAKTGEAALIRYSEKDAFMLVPPVMASDGLWHEVQSPADVTRAQHTPEEVEAAVGIRVEVVP